MPPEAGETRPERTKGNLKHRVAHEFVRYWTNVLYLSIFFGAFAWYRRIVLAEYQITYLHYGAAIVEALILAKVILIGDALGLNRESENQPLIYPTLRKTVMFSCFVGLFAVVEHIVFALVHGKGMAAGLATLWSEGKYEILSRILVNFFAFIPFFAFRELGFALGKGRLRNLFFRRGAVMHSGSQA